jgi:DNA-binding NtrC family response regulator
VKTVRSKTGAYGVPSLTSMHPAAARWIGALIRMTSAHPAMTRILNVVEGLQDRPFRTNALLLGEPGTGKEGLARALHHLMAPGTPLVRVDLVGYSDAEALALLSGGDGKGAHGAVAEAGDGATLLIEEAAGLSLRVQTALLRLLKTGVVDQEGNSGKVLKTAKRFQVNAIAMSDRDLAAEVAAGRFRHDLYFALARIVLDLPPLRERMQDLAPAAVWIGNRVLRNAGRDYELMTAEEFARATSDDRAAAIELRADAIEALQRHTWPGNFRELEAVLERALMLYRKGTSIGAGEIEAALATAS